MEGGGEMQWVGREKKPLPLALAGCMLLRLLMVR